MSLYLGNRKPIDYSNAKIYKITCIINNKVYIGQTTTSIEKRFKQHLSKSSFCKKLKYAIKKYGKENFVIEQIDSATTKQEADKKEKMYIQKYNSINCGYNVTLGGSDLSNVVCKPVICIETGKVYSSASDASREFNTESSTLTMVCNGKKKTFKGYHWAYLDENGKPILDNIDLTTTPRKTRVRCIETGKIYTTQKEASVDVGCSASQLGNALTGKFNVRTAGGYHWQYVDKENNSNKKEKSNNKKKVKVMCKETGKVYNSISECAKDMKCYRSNIYRSMDSGFACKGFHFEQLKEVA